MKLYSFSSLWTLAYVVDASSIFKQVIEQSDLNALCLDEASFQELEACVAENVHFDAKDCTNLGAGFRASAKCLIESCRASCEDNIAQFERAFILVANYTRQTDFSQGCARLMERYLSDHGVCSFIGGDHVYPSEYPTVFPTADPPTISPTESPTASPTVLETVPPTGNNDLVPTPGFQLPIPTAGTTQRPSFPQPVYSRHQSNKVIMLLLLMMILFSLCALGLLIFRRNQQSRERCALECNEPEIEYTKKHTNVMLCPARVDIDH